MSELVQKEEEQLLKLQFKITCEGLKPVNMIKNAIDDFATKPGIKENLLSKSLSLAAGYIFKKIVIGNTSNPVKQLFGTFLQVAVSALVSTNKETIKQAAFGLLNATSVKKHSTRQ